MKYYYHHHHHSRRIYSLDKERRAPLNHNTNDKRRPSKVKRKTNNRRTLFFSSFKSGSFHSAGSRRKMKKILVVWTLAKKKTKKKKKKQVAPSFHFVKFTSVLILSSNVVHIFSSLDRNQKDAHLHRQFRRWCAKFTKAKKANRFSFLVIQCGWNAVNVALGQNNPPESQKERKQQQMVDLGDRFKVLFSWTTTGSTRFDARNKRWGGYIPRPV